MKAITERLEWLEHYIRNSTPVEQHGCVTADKEIAWTQVQELRAIAETLPDQPMAPPFVNGCICPAGSETTCKSAICGRHNHARAVVPIPAADPIGDATRSVVEGRRFQADASILKRMLKVENPDDPGQWIEFPLT